MDSDSENLLVPPRKSSIPSFISVREDSDDTAAAFVSAIEPGVSVSTSRGDCTESDQMSDSSRNGQECTVVIDSREGSTDTAANSVSTEKKSDQPGDEDQCPISPPASVRTTSTGRNTQESRDNLETAGIEDQLVLSEQGYQIAHSKPVYFFYVVSLMLSIAAVVMGGIFTKRCPVAPELPLMIFMMGVAGTLSLIFKATDLLHERLYSRTEGHNVFYEVTCFVGFFIVVIILLTEISLVMQTDPSNNSNSKQYCHPVFYNFAYWTNWVGLIFAVIAAAIHGPGLICRRTKRRRLLSSAEYLGC